MIKQWIKWLLAYYHLSQTAVCEMSASLGSRDYHDYHDDIQGYPDHFAVLECRYCRKKFIM